MNFTKEYIELCKDKKIQELKAEMDNFDHCLFFNALGRHRDFKLRCDYLTKKGWVNVTPESYIWLPTGDQLDEEIIKICKEMGSDYRIYFDGHISKRKWYVSVKIDDSNYYLSGSDTNPLIAKIKLLLELLKGE
jgi:hypothetical protein